MHADVDRTGMELTIGAKMNYRALLTGFCFELKKIQKLSKLKITGWEKVLCEHRKTPRTGI